MQFFMPTKLYIESNAVRNHAAELASLGTRALIVTGRSSAAKNGSLADVKEALESFSVEYDVFPEIEENPSVETVMKGRDFGLECGSDFVVGIGGGSALDAAKGIALMVRQREKTVDYLYEPGGSDDALPVACVPTTCGTGSEVTSVFILTRHDLRAKGSSPHKLFPRLALVDGKYLASAPRSVLNDTSIDALGHLIESHINTKATDITRMITREGLRVWSESRDILTGSRAPDETDYLRMMTASALGGMAIAHTGTTLPHGLSYGITYEMGMPHGKAIGYFLAGYLDAAPSDMTKDILSIIGFRSTEEFKAFYTAVCEPETVPDELIQNVVDNQLRRGDKLALCPFDTPRETVEKIAYYMRK